MTDVFPNSVDRNILDYKSYIWIHLEEFVNYLVLTLWQKLYYLTPMITEQLLLYLHIPALWPKANNLWALSTGLVLKYLYAVITRRCWRYPMMAPLSRFMMPGLHHLSKYPLQIVQVVYSILYSQLRPFKSPHGNLLPT